MNLFQEGKTCAARAPFSARRPARKVLARTDKHGVGRSVARVERRSQHYSSASGTFALNRPFDEVGGDPARTAQRQRDTEFKRRAHEQRYQGIAARQDGDDDCASVKGRHAWAPKLAADIRRGHGSSLQSTGSLRPGWSNAQTVT